MMIKQKQIDNPCDICSWRQTSGCKDCLVAERLKCRYNLGDPLHFTGLFWTFAIPAFVGTILGGYSLYILGWIVLWLSSLIFGKPVFFVVTVLTMLKERELGNLFVEIIGQRN